MKNGVLFELFKEATSRSKEARQSAANLSLTEGIGVTSGIKKDSYYLNPQILDSLRSISEPLADGYFQIIADFDDEKRISWAGTAHEIRELIRKILEHLAPAKVVESEPWYKKQSGTSGPTQRQRVRYILSVRNSDTKQQKVAQDINIINDKIGELVRDVYGRASDAAHRSKNKTEAFRILKYFEAFAYDLLDLNP